MTQPAHVCVAFDILRWQRFWSTMLFIMLNQESLARLAIRFAVGEDRNFRNSSDLFLSPPGNFDLQGEETNASVCHKQAAMVGIMLDKVDK